MNTAANDANVADVDHARLKMLFEAVCDMAHGTTDAALDALAATTEERAAIMVLLEQDAKVNATTTTRRPIQPARPVAAMLANFAVAAPLAEAVKPGDAIDAWIIAEKIGEGGMGAVYRAQRNDGQFSQTVAIKFLAGMATPHTNARLREERKTLAGLAHPNIARLIDGGATPAGQPYIVMDYVDGTNIAEHCRAQKCTLREVAALMAQVCGAVSHAHQSLVLHCDLKPANILVDKTGQVKLLDFGIAELLTGVAESQAETASATADAAPRASSFTPRYASPEQRAGYTLSTATDVFSLGRVLQELVDGARGSSGFGARLRLAEADAVAARAAADNMADRYRGVAEIHADLQRLLANRPLAVMQGGAWYHAQKLLARRPAAALALALAVSAALFFTHSLVQERDRALQAEARAATELARAQAAEEVARLERDRAQVSELRASSREQEAVAARAAAVGERDRAIRAEIQTQIQSSRTRDTRDFLFSLFDSADPNRGGTPKMTAADLLARGRQRVNSLPAAQHEFKTDMWLVLARIHENIGLFDAAKTLYRDAAVGLKQDMRPAGRHQYAGALDRIAVIENNSSNHAAAEAPAREALLLRRQHPLKDANAQALAVANAQNTLGLVQDSLGRRDESRQLLQTALATREKLSRAPSEEVASTLHNLGRHHARHGEYKEAEKSLLRSLDIKYSLFGKHHPKVLNGRQELAQILVDQRRHAEAEPLLADNYQARLQVHGDTSEYVSAAANEWGSVLHDLGRYAEAELRYRDAIDISARAADPGRPLPVTHAIGVNNLAGLYEETGDLVRAEENYRLSMRVRRANLQADDLSVARIEHNLGRLLLKVGKTGEAETLLRQAYQTRLKKRGLAHGETHETILALAERAQLDGDAALTANLLGSLDEKIIAQRPTRALQKMRIDALLAPAAPALAIWQARQALAEKSFGATHLISLRAKLDTAEALHRLGRAADARQLALEVKPRFDALLVTDAMERRRIAALLAVL